MAGARYTRADAGTARRRASKDAGAEVRPPRSRNAGRMLVEAASVSARNEQAQRIPGRPASAWPDQGRSATQCVRSVHVRVKSSRTDSRGLQVTNGVNDTRLRA